MILKEVLDRTTEFFKQKKINSPRLESELILAHGLKLERMDLYLQFERPLTDAELSLCRSYVKRRSDGEPVAYIVGEKGFYTEVLKVNENVLIPRPETELIVDEVIKKFEREESRKFLDIGTGSGCIGLTILKHFKNFEAILLDISKPALDVTKENAEKLNVSDRASLVCDDILKTEFLENSFDFVVANPPYIDLNSSDIQESVKDYEPHIALFAENNGFQCVQKWSEVVSHCLKPDGFFVFEIGFDQGQRSLECLESLGFQDIQVKKDLSGHDRIVLCKK